MFRARPASKRRRESSPGDGLTGDALCEYKRTKTTNLAPKSDISRFEAPSQPELQLGSITSPSSSSGTEDTGFSSNTSLSSLSRCSSSNPTHDTSRTSFHIKDLATFATTLEEAAKGAFPNRGRSRYAKVNAALIRWAEDKTVQPELERLYNVFKDEYGFTVEDWTIPTINSHRKLMGKALDFIEEFDARDNLFIVYYAGHGTINENRQSVWCCTRDPKYASLDWSSIQSLFDNASSDVLILLDCCAAASSINTSGHGVNETIAACGFEDKAPPPGPHSFTNTLIEVLEEWKGRVHFSISVLYSEVLFQLKRKRPEKGRDGIRIPGWCSTPVHYISSSDPSPQSIELGRMQVPTKDTTMISSPHPPFPHEAGPPESALQDEQITSSTSESPIGNRTFPHVLISVALEEDQAELNLESCRLWLTRFPALAKYATVQGVFMSHSTLLLISLPIAIWNMLPDNKACSFIGFVTSRNLACMAAITDEETAAQVPSEASSNKLIELAPASDPILDWYSTDYGPWTNHVSDKLYAIGQPSSSIHNLHSSSSMGYAHPGALRYRAPYSDSGYGSRQSVANTSVFEHDEANQDSFQLPRKTGDWQPLFQPFSEQMSWSPSPIANRELSVLFCPMCKQPVKTASELKKHELRHTKAFKCTVPGCLRTEGFSTPNDLDRHMKSRHSELVVENPLLKRYRCLVQECKSREKSWPRQDNFRSHLKRIHPNEVPTEEALDQLVARGEFWEMFDANKSLQSMSEFKFPELFGDSSNVQKNSKVDNNQISGTHTEQSSLKPHHAVASVFPAPVQAIPGQDGMKRHERPYGCTSPDCHKSFGSKKDWIEHENSQHKYVECWICDLQLDSEGACMKICFWPVTFCEHLTQDHNICDENTLKSKLKKCHRIGQDCEGYFWCGFCNKRIDQKKTGMDARTERFDHIDDHFMGRTGEKKSIREWAYTGLLRIWPQN